LDPPVFGLEAELSAAHLTHVFPTNFSALLNFLASVLDQVFGPARSLLTVPPRVSILLITAILNGSHTHFGMVMGELVLWRGSRTWEHFEKRGIVAAVPYVAAVSVDVAPVTLVVAGFHGCVSNLLFYADFVADVSVDF